jgi:hypothetical protein
MICSTIIPTTINQGEAVLMNWQENDERHENEVVTRAKSFQRTKFRYLDDDDNGASHRAKRSGKRSHRQKTIKDDYWPDRGE